MHVIKTGPSDGRKSRKRTELVQCHRCGGREVIQTRIGMHFVNGKATGGTKAIICAMCNRNGERVVVA